MFGKKLNCYIDDTDKKDKIMKRYIAFLGYTIIIDYKDKVKTRRIWMNENKKRRLL